MSFIKSIRIKEDLHNYKFHEESDLIENISKVNIFIGSNNSGKSRLLRGILNDTKIKINSKTKELEEYNNLISVLNGVIKKSFEISSCITGIDSVSKSYMYNTLEYICENNIELRDEFWKEFNKYENVTGSSLSYYGGSYDHNKDTLVDNIKSIDVKYRDKCTEIVDNTLISKNYKRIYIPILRGLRKLASEDIFASRTKDDYFTDELHKNIEIFTGQIFYEDILKLLCGGFKERTHLREFEEFLGENFFDGRRITLIPKYEENTVYVKIGDEKEYPIYDLGDGIQSIIILTFKLFSNKGDDVLFFIEEPELYLHPGLQRKMLDIFMDKQFESFQFFITSHSNHLLDLTLDIDDISIYKFNKEIENDKTEEKVAKFNIENVKNDDSTLLKLLGVNNSSIFLSNCTIWVEGITDRFYLRKYLDVYQKHMHKDNNNNRIFEEDIHYSFMEYSGGNITHWDFLDNDSEDEIESIFKKIKHDRICNKIFLISDSDEAKEGTEKYIRQQKLEEFFKEQFYCLKSKEIENILLPKILKKVIYEFADKRVKKDADINGDLFSASKFDINDYKNVNLGEFIENRIDKQIEIRKNNDSSFDYLRKKKFKNGNTISNKIDFCKYAVQHINSIEDMSSEAIELCEKIYKFIKRNN